LPTGKAKNMFNPYLPANHQDAGNEPEPRELKCEVCGLYCDSPEEIESIEETGYCTDCGKRYLK